jgi:hypothetical protein
MTTSDELRMEIEDLVERATGLEAKAAEAGLLDAPAEPLADLDLQGLLDRVAELEDTVFALTNSTPADEEAGDFTDADLDLPDDFEPVAPLAEDVPKSFMPCPSCGRKDADVYADGTARCEHDGSPLMVEEKAADLELDPDDYPFVDPEPEPEPVEEPKADLESVETKAADDAPDIATLMERRKALAAE